MRRNLMLAGPVVAVFLAACGSSDPSSGAPGDNGGNPLPGAPPPTGGVVTDPGGGPGGVLPDGPATPAPDANLPRLYVATTGNDQAPCTKDRPCRQIKRALTQAKVATGAVIEVADGSYAGFTVSRWKGTKAAPLFVRATGDAAEITPGSDNDTMFVDQSSYVVLEGLRSAKARRAAVRISGSKFVTVRRCELADNGRWGIFTDFADDVLLEDNKIHGSEDEHGIYVSNSGDRPVIRRNVIYGNNASGIQINADYEVKDDYDVYDGEDDGLCTGALIVGNTIYGNGAGGGAALNLDGVKDSLVANNLLYGNRASGIVMYGDADGEAGDGLGGGDSFDGNGRWGPSGVLVLHNTIVMPAGARSALLVRYSQGTKKNVLRNNIVVHPGGKTLDTASGDDALLDAASNTIGNASLLGALFADAAKNDYRLRDGAAAIDAGETRPEVPTDIVGKARPAGRAADIGAYER